MLRKGTDPGSGLKMLKHKALAEEIITSMVLKEQKIIHRINDDSSKP